MTKLNLNLTNWMYYVSFIVEVRFDEGEKTYEPTYTLSAHLINL